MPSLSAYHLTWVSLTLDVGHFFTAAPPKRSRRSLPWMWGSSSWPCFCATILDAEYIIRNAGLEEAQAGIKFPERNISNLRYADDTTLMAESEEELKSLLTKVKEESEKVGLKLNI